MQPFDPAGLTDQQLVEARNAIDAEQARRANTGETVVSYQVRRAIPAGGALLHVQEPAKKLRTADWFPTVEIALAALGILAAERGRPIHEDGVTVWLDGPEAATGATAWVERRRVYE